MNFQDLPIIEQLQLLRITADSQIPPHRFLFSWNGTPCFAKAELVAVTGKAKSGKTYLNSMLMAAATADRNVLGLKRIDDKPLRIVWIDTEQSNDTTCEILRDRIAAMTGHKPDDELFHVFNLRQVRWQDRLTLVLSTIAICKPDLVIFDGIRDVVGDINSYEEAQSVITQLLHVASEYQPCIVCVLHQNKAIEDKTLRGALGTELQNKSFETYECSKNPDTRIFSIKQTATRKYDLPNRIDFCLSNDGLPVPCAVPDNSRLEPADVFAAVMNGHSEMRAGVLKTQTKLKFRINSDSDYGALLSQALRDGILTRKEISDHEVYYLPGPNLAQTSLNFGG